MLVYPYPPTSEGIIHEHITFFNSLLEHPVYAEYQYIYTCELLYTAGVRCCHFPALALALFVDQLPIVHVHVPPGHVSRVTLPLLQTLNAQCTNCKTRHMNILLRSSWPSLQLLQLISFVFHPYPSIVGWWFLSSNRFNLSHLQSRPGDLSVPMF